MSNISESQSSLPIASGVWKYHLVALFTAVIWSTTFVSTKVLLNSGMTPDNIFLYRFLIAYILILFVARGKLFARSLRDEFMMFLAGITGGSLYFLTENSALSYTYATNVSILIAGTPLLTIGLSAIIFRKKLNLSMLGGSLMALVGVSLVVFNGDASFQISPIGDFLIFTAALCWAFYSVILKYLGNRDYTSLFITRKVFFYGLATILIYHLFAGRGLQTDLLRLPEVYGNLLFLGVFASLLCYMLWNKVVEVIGPDKATNYIYLNPIGTIITAVIFLNEPLSWMAIVGATVIIIGVVIVEKSHS